MSPLQRLLDKLTVHLYIRWAIFATVYSLFLLRIVSSGFAYPAVLYFNSANLLFSFILFITPAVDMESAHAVDILPSKDNDKAFPRKLPEFKAWRQVTGMTAGCLFFTLIPGVELIPCDVPILVIYFVGMLIYLIGDRIRVRALLCRIRGTPLPPHIRFLPHPPRQHMRKYNYSPFTFGKVSGAASAKTETKKEYARRA